MFIFTDQKIQGLEISPVKVDKSKYGIRTEVVEYIFFQNGNIFYNKFQQ